MGFLQSVFDSPTPPVEPDPEPEPVIEPPKDTYNHAYPVAIRWSPLTAFQYMINADRDTPYVDGPEAEFLLNPLDEA